MLLSNMVINRLNTTEKQNWERAAGKYVEVDSFRLDAGINDFF